MVSTGEPTRTTPSQRSRCVGCCFTSSGWYKHIEPLEYTTHTLTELCKVCRVLKLGRGASSTANQHEPHTHRESKVCKAPWSGAFQKCSKNHQISVLSLPVLVRSPSRVDREADFELSKNIFGQPRNKEGARGGYTLRERLRMFLHTVLLCLCRFVLVRCSLVRTNPHQNPRRPTYPGNTSNPTYTRDSSTVYTVLP